MIPLNLIVEERLGAGVFGEVWSARDENHRLFAVKFFDGENADASQRSALAHANALIRVRHPGVVRVHAISHVQHPDKGIQLALVMEHVSGTALNKIQNALNAHNAMAAIHQIAGGLQAIHEEGLVHGDLHSGNVIVTASGARLIDLFYTHTQAGETVSSRQLAQLQDVRDFAKVAAEIVRLVPEFSRAQIDQSLELAQAEQVNNPLKVAQAFAMLAREHAFNLVSSVKDAFAHLKRPLPPGTNTFFLAISKLDRWGTSHVTRIIGDGRIIAAYPGVLIATSQSLYRLRYRRRRIELLREEYIDEWRTSQGATKESAYVATQIEDAVLDDGVGMLSIASAEPTNGSRLELFEFSRSIAVQGLVGPYLFIEESDWQYAGGAHPDTICRFSVLDTEQAIRLTTILSEDEHIATVAREGRVAKEMFKVIRDDAVLFPDEIGVELSSICPVMELEGEARMHIRFLFTTSAAFTTSDHRWSSYTVSEEVVAKKLPELISMFAEVPQEICDPLRGTPGTVIGWSRIQRGHPQFLRLDAIIAE